VSFPRLGVIGAGQLARMMVAPATELGINLRLLAETPDDSGAQICDHFIGNPSEIEAVLQFARTCDVVTFEHEQVPQSVIKELERNGIKVYPRSDSFIFSQNKVEMRKKMDELNLPNPKWNHYEGGPSPIDFPLIAKTITGGYDGRGVFVIASQSELDNLYSEISQPLLLEEMLSFSSELAVMVARSPHGQASTWAPTWTVQSNGICTSTVTPAPDLDDELSAEAAVIALKIAEGIGLIGVMAVEFFLVDGQLIINELALRPHNSGHWTIEGSTTSQFEQHIRAVLDLPLGATSLTSPWAVMGNILGGDKKDMYRPYLHLMARTPGLKFHHYRKEVRPGRKIGHVTLLGENLVELRGEVQHALDYLSGVVDE
jgi:5-(carboxyamino)imidazole ribonucleotide synthase